MENKLKHLEFIQLVITRMNVNSFLLKGWTVTLISALFVLAAKDAKASYVFITYIATPLFWILDGYYLSVERQYRDLYNEVRIKDKDSIDFNLKADKFDIGKNRLWPCIFSPTLLLFYGALMAVVLIIYFIIK